MFDGVSSSIRRLLKGDGRRVLENISWLLLDRGLRIILGLAVGIWLARYLGPEDFGTLNFTIALIALLNPLVTLGLEDIVVRDLIKNPEQATETLGTTFVMQFIAGFAGVIVAYTLFYLLKADDISLRNIAAILSLGFVIQSTNMIRYWYQSQVLAKHVVRVQIAALVITSALRITCIINSADLSIFAWLIVAESAIVSFGLAKKFFSRYAGRLTFNPGLAFRLLKDSWPLILSGLAIVTYMRIDQVMIGSLEGTRSVGIYSAALTISEAWYFVPMAIVASAFPGIIQTKQNNADEYAAKTQRLLSTLFLMSVSVASLFSLASSQLVQLLYGDTFAKAASVLAIHAWAGIFVALGLVSGRWFINEGLQLLQLYKLLAGALTNILLNLVLIPAFGVTGAATATLISFGVAAYLSDYFFVATRPMFVMKTRAVRLEGLLIYRSQ